MIKLGDRVMTKHPLSRQLVRGKVYSTHEPDGLIVVILDRDSRGVETVVRRKESELYVLRDNPLYTHGVIYE